METVSIAPMTTEVTISTQPKGAVMEASLHTVFIIDANPVPINLAAVLAIKEYNKNIFFQEPLAHSSEKFGGTSDIPTCDIFFARLDRKNI